MRGWLTARGGVPVLIWALAIAGGILSLCETPLWWFGGSLLVAAITLVLREYKVELAALLERARAPRRLLGRERVPLAFATDAACIAFVCFIATVMMWDMVAGQRPVSHDHTVHYFKAWQLHHDLLPHGKLYGWSNRMFAGYPANYLYPPGADLWVNAVHALFLGAMSFSQAYAIAFWFFHVFSGLAVYRFGRAASAGRCVGHAGRRRCA